MRLLPRRILATGLLGVAVGCNNGLIGGPGGFAGRSHDDEARPSDPRTDELTDPGRVTLHRLNRVEFNNTVRDLLGTTQTPAADFPPDDRGYGFDNIADVLSTSPLHLEMYQAAAESLVNEALGSTAPSSEPASARARILVCAEETDACARRVLGSFAQRAWRRPPTDAEVDRLMDFPSLAREQGDGWEQGIRLALQAVLVSPHFVFRVEIDPDPTSTDAHLLNDWEMASRLSYFLWSSMPDEELFALAEAGMLQDEEVLRAQAMRMLEDPRAEALVANFAGQWLFGRKVDDHVPDYDSYPAYDEPLGQSMKRELEMFFRTFLYEDIPVAEMLTADWTYVDDRLAAHYGLHEVGGELTRVVLPPERRAGLLGKGAILMVTSHATRTSPVKRGVWVLEQLLCSAPPPPPPGVEGLEEQELTAGTLRERMEMHRRDPVCASCHELMDPIGLGLENFDGIGRFRTQDSGEAIDASGAMPSGEAFVGAVELGRILAADERLPRCVARQMMTYAIGRGFEHDDTAWVDAITETYRSDGLHLRALIAAIVTSDPFRMRRGEGIQEEGR